MKYRFAMWLLVSFFAVAAPAMAEIAAETTKTGIQSLLSKYDQALVEQDLAGVLDTFMADAILMGTGPGEQWRGTEAIKEAYQHFFADYDAGSLLIDCTWRSAGSNDSLTWLTAMCWFTDYLKNEKREFAVNMSAVAEKQGEAWRFRTFHFSNVTALEQPEQAAP
jgi:uncharacterized protein (TIGR02246 family)